MKSINAFQQEGKIKNPREDVLTFKHMADGVVHFNSTRIVKHDPTNVADVTAAENQRARADGGAVQLYERKRCGL